MVASTDIKWFSSDNFNAPQLTNDWGVLIGVLDACLINGMSVQSVASLTATGTIATVTFNTAHQYKQYQVIEISGAAQSEYNVQARILTVPNANSITFELAVAPSAITATGAITCKLPPLGWEKPFGNTGQKGAYRSKNTLLPSRPYLRVDNSLDPTYTTTYAKYAKVGMVEIMTDIDVMSGVQAPYDASAPTKNWVGTGSGTSGYNGWAKWIYATGSNSLDAQSFPIPPIEGNRSWIIVGSGNYFYFFNALTPGETTYVVNMFGYFDSLLPIDSGNTVLVASMSYATTGTSVEATDYSGITRSGTAKMNMVFVRKYTQAAESSEGTISPQYLNSSNSLYTGGIASIPAPNTDIPIYSSDVVLYEKSSGIPRGVLPGYRWLYQQFPYTNKQVFIDSGYSMIALNVVAGNSNAGQVVVRIA